jgi:hypothetical protein
MVGGRNRPGRLGAAFALLLPPFAAAASDGPPLSPRAMGVACSFSCSTARERLLRP